MYTKENGKLLQVILWNDYILHIPNLIWIYYPYVLLEVTDMQNFSYSHRDVIVIGAALTLGIEGYFTEKTELPSS